ncbi:BsuPI-related putative proteinase inhibitor [Fredinandcohnia sp. 179-A 10B2 NHS]|uniref:BsuPI-related putative proteinase inhibitor n=1 Tax=Fredinandcohnia sp. 179-A 10B2 NHS TaxID=3235176 RepID=UPI00399F0573
MRGNLLFVVIVGFIFVLTACQEKPRDATSKVDQDDATSSIINNGIIQSEKTDVNTESEGTGVIAEELVSFIEEKKDNDEAITLAYGLKNISEKDVEIPFTKNGGFAYIVRDSEGNKVSEEQASVDITTNQVVASGEYISCTVILDGLSKGNYEIEIWLNSDLENTYNETYAFEVK